MRDAAGQSLRSEGTEITTAGSHQEIRDLLEAGLSLADIVMPRTRPDRAGQLTLFGDE